MYLQINNIPLMCIQFSTYLLTYRKRNLCLFSILKKGNLKDVSLNNQLVGQPINFKDLGKNEKSRSSPSCNTSASPLYRNLNNEKKNNFNYVYVYSDV